MKVVVDKDYCFLYFINSELYQLVTKEIYPFIILVVVFMSEWLRAKYQGISIRIEELW